VVEGQYSLVIPPVKLLERLIHHRWVASPLTRELARGIPERLAEGLSLRY
jgi:hypothetical protein